MRYFCFQSNCERKESEVSRTRTSWEIFVLLQLERWVNICSFVVFFLVRVFPIQSTTILFNFSGLTNWTEDALCRGWTWSIWLIVFCRGNLSVRIGGNGWRFCANFVEIILCERKLNSDPVSCFHFWKIEGFSKTVSCWRQKKCQEILSIFSKLNSKNPAHRILVRTS